MASAIAQKHVVLSSSAPWSHSRALSVFAARLASERPITVTVVVPYWMKTFDQVNAEVARYLADVPDPQGAIRIIALGEHNTTARIPFDIFAVGLPELPALWEALVIGSSVQCSATGKTYDPVAPPSLIMLDGFLHSWYPTIRRISPTIPLLCWATGVVSGIIYHTLPARLGGKYADDVHPHVLALDSSEMPPPVEYTGRIIKIAGLPAMYDWEFAPQTVSPFSGKIGIVLGRTVHDADGIVLQPTTAIEGTAALDVLTSWAAETKRPVFSIGPLLPFKDGTTQFSQAALRAEIVAAPPGVGDKIMSFLDNALATKGEASVVYIGFGSHFWPANPGHLWALLEALTHADRPFVLCHASSFAQVPEEISARYTNSTQGLLVPWTPQQAVLAHKAVGWFVSHGGAGGIADSLTQGVPIIGWPFTADQPQSIAYLAHTADVAFELREMRNGDQGLKPILATGQAPTGTLDAFKAEIAQLLQDMTGESGERKRRNAKRMQKEAQGAWVAGGPARRGFEELVKRYEL